MNKLSIEQLKRASEILGNISVAWFSAGVISPLFIHAQNLMDLFFTFTISFIMSIFFFVMSLELVKEKNL